MRNRPKWDIDLSQMIAVVTGGGGALCSEMAIALARLDVSVAVLDLDEHSAWIIAERIAQSGGQGIALGCDVTEVDSLKLASREVTENFG